MIYPTRFGVIAALAGAPVALVLGLLAPQLWLAAPAWLLALAVLMLIDAILTPPARALELTLDRPEYLAVDAEAQFRVAARFAGRRSQRFPLQLALVASDRTGLRDAVGRRADETTFVFPARPRRRGQAEISQATARWRGPLGLTWRQARRTLDVVAPIGAHIRRIEDEALNLFSRDALHGAKVQTDVGEGAEFHALNEFQSGMDRRAIDWKQSARHQSLLAKEFRIERNHQVVIALDCGRVMSEPIGSAPRIDRAIHAALILAYAALRSGDRAALFAFDDRPRLSTGAVAGVGGFPLLVRQAARIDYGVEEANYAFGLTSLSSSLKRRSLVVVFTEFADTTAAELMIETTARLVRTHLVLFAVMREAELEALVTAEPSTPEDVARAVVAASLLRERDIVLGRLRRLGAHIVEGPADRLGPEVFNAYLDLKRRDLL